VITKCCIPKIALFYPLVWRCIW